MIKNKAFFAAIKRASGKLRARKIHICSAAEELEGLIDAYLSTDRNYARTAAALGLSYKVVSTRIRLLIKTGVKIEVPRIGAPRWSMEQKWHAKKARLVKCCALHLADLQREHGAEPKREADFRNVEHAP